MAVNPQESAGAQFLSLSPRAQKYMDTAVAVAELRELAAEHPEDVDKYQLGIDRGEVIMCITEAAAAEDFVTVVEIQEPADRVNRRRIIESVREDADFGTVITEADIQSQLDALPPFDDYSPEVRTFVSGYFDAIGEWLIAANGETPATGGGDSTRTGEADGEDSNPADPEAVAEKPTLTITIYKDQVIQLGEEGQMVSLMRSMDIPLTTPEELYIADARLAALRLVSGHDVEEGQKGLSSNDVWKSYAGGTKFNTNQHLVVSDFLESLQVDGDQVLNVRKPTEKSRDYSNGGYDITFVEVDEESGLEQDDLFRLPNGEIIFGKRARVAHMLMRASKEQPVSLQDLLDSDVYTDEEKAEMNDKKALSSMVSFLEQRLELEGLLVAEGYPARGYTIRSTFQSDRSKAYWMSYRAEDEFPEGESDIERERSVTDCRKIADWLVGHEEALVRLGYKPFDATHQAALFDADTYAPTPKKEVKDELELRFLFELVKGILSDDAGVEEIMEKLQDGDPRWPVVDYLVASIAKDADTTTMTVDKLIEDFPELDVRIDQQIASLHDGLIAWPDLRSDREKEIIAELTYDLFDRIGNGLRIRDNVRDISIKAILAEVSRRMTDIGLTPLRQRTEQAFNNAYGQWVQRTRADTATRAKRREWGKQVRSALNAALRA